MQVEVLPFQTRSSNDVPFAIYVICVYGIDIDDRRSIPREEVNRKGEMTIFFLPTGF